MAEFSFSDFLFNDDPSIDDILFTGSSSASSKDTHNKTYENTWYPSQPPQPPAVAFSSTFPPDSARNICPPLFSPDPEGQGHIYQHMDPSLMTAGWTNPPLVEGYTQHTIQLQPSSHTSPHAPSVPTPQPAPPLNTQHARLTTEKSLQPENTIPVPDLRPVSPEFHDFERRQNGDINMTLDESMSTAANSDTHENSTGRDRIEANSSSWAARNPGQPVIPIRPAPARKTGAELASLRIASEQKKAKEELFHTALKKIADTQHNLIVEAAAAHNVTVEKALRLYNGYRNYAPSRKAQLSNALLHAKAKEVNQDRPAGAKYTTKEIRELIKDDPDMRDLDSDQEQAFIEQLNEHRKLQKFGLRANNTAAARDMLCTLDNVCGTLDSMARRTGSYAVFFATRGHVNDLGEPTWHGTDNAMDFFEDVLGLEADDICRKFEQWACTRNENGLERDSLLNVRRACIRFIKSGLNALIGKNKGISMNYENYEKNIMQKYRVQLIGWPTDIPFVSPSKINTITEARKLRDALKDGTCHWAPMSAKEVEAHTKSIETRLAEGVKVGKPRAPRADKGRARGKRAGRGKENSQPSKRAKAMSSQPKRNVPTSAATVEDSEEDEESENDDD